MKEFVANDHITYGFIYKFILDNKIYDQMLLNQKF